jgi:hypothetical protein
MLLFHWLSSNLIHVKKLLNLLLCFDFSAFLFCQTASEDSAWSLALAIGLNFGKVIWMMIP